MGIGSLADSSDSPWIQDDEDRPQFFRVKGGPKVHVWKRREPFDVDGISVQPLVAALLARDVGYCGARMEASDWGRTARFPDEDLCYRCRQLWPHDPGLLFEHDIR